MAAVNIRVIVEALGVLSPVLQIRNGHEVNPNFKPRPEKLQQKNNAFGTDEFEFSGKSADPAYAVKHSIQLLQPAPVAARSHGQIQASRASPAACKSARCEAKCTRQVGLSLFSSL
jgi:hypothetical protein